MIDAADHQGNCQLSRAPTHHASRVPVRADRETAALVLCGGGSRGAMDVGFYQALSEYGIGPGADLGSAPMRVQGSPIAPPKKQGASRQLQDSGSFSLPVQQRQLASICQSPLRETDGRGC